MIYQVPEHIDKDKVFVVKRSEIEKRFDPKIALFNRKVQHSLYPKTKLKDLLVCKPQYGAAEPGIIRTDPKSPRYIRITDIDEYGLITHKDIGVTANLTDDKYVLHENDLLIARSGATVGKSYIHKKSPYTCFFAGYLIRFVINPQRALPDYVFAFTQTETYKEWVNAIQRPSGQPNINAEEYQSLEIPLPPIDTQDEIVSVLHAAYSNKYKKESEAQQLLDGIDTYLLDELGIILPEIGNTLEDRMFIVKRGQLEGRLDPIYYSADISTFTQSTYSERLFDLVLSFENGFAVGRQNQVDPEKGILQIRPTNINDNGRLTFEKNVFVPEKEDTPFVKTGVVLFNNTNSQEWVGKTAYFANKENRNVYTSNHITAINVDRKKIMPEYLCAILNFYQRHKIFYSICTNWNNQSGIGLDLLKSLQIPLFSNDRKVSLHKQHQIVDRINTIYQKAKVLQEEGKAILEQAKQEVEQMIIG